jgi:hypothetical protein
MNRCRFRPRLAALALPVLLSWLPATTVIPPSFDQLVNSADYVVRATVTSVTSEWRDNPDRPGSRYIGSLVELEVHEVVKGAPPARLVLDLVGGKVGDEELVIEGTPRLLVGQESFLFIRGNGRQVVPLVGLSHGHYPVRRDKQAGTDQVLHSSGRLLYSEQEIGRGGPAPARDAAARPLSAAEFSRRIRGTIRTPESTREELD